MTESATLADAIESTVESKLADIRVGGVGIIQSYNHDEQRADVQPVVKTRFRDADGELTYVKPPVIPNVEIKFPAGSKGASIVWPLSKGDQVYLCIADRSHDEWKGTGNKGTEPSDPRKFDLTDAFGFPTQGGPSDPIDPDQRDAGALVVSADKVKLGSANNTEPVAIGPDVETYLKNLVTEIVSNIVSPYNAHSHPDPVSGPLPPPQPSATAPTSPIDDEFNSDNVEAKDTP